MELLKALCLTPGVPGREHRIRQLILERIEGLFDEVSVDPLGSIIAVRKARPNSSKTSSTEDRPHPTRIMLAAHMDQIGFVVRHIGSDGFVRIQPVGGFDARNLFARLVQVAPDLEDPSKDLLGVLNPGVKPTHIANDDDRKKIPELSDFVIDFGMPAEQVKQRIKLGDMVTLAAPFNEVGDAVVSQAMDNRIACWIAIRAIEKLVEDQANHAAEIHCGFTVQEEVGLRGAVASAHTVQPDIGIAIDTTLCVDTPGVPEDQRCTEFGKGAALTVMDSASIADWPLFHEFEAIAKQHNIPHQRSILARGGTDSGGMQRQAGGVRTFTLSLPTRYIHTVTETIHKNDLNACRDLLAAYLAQAE
ncbi:MAG: M20/M25/M40 family metallo-hydrolase [Planctomycetota bacterium]